MRLLAIKNISYAYEGTAKKVLQDASIEFQEGRVYAIVGKSGSGKTTLLSLISGLDICKDGVILYRDKDVRSIDRDEYRAKEIGVIFQSYNLLINATAVENIVLSMNISSVDIKDKKQYAYELLQKVGIDKDTADRKILKLSGGEQQRVGIARAISHNPNIVIADEPTGNLDSDTERSIMDILLSLAHEEGKCVILVTHSKKISSYADEVWGMNEGKLLFVK